ncbi:MAG: VTT domain-containing protein [Syntrophomonadaceae bacterium]|nr:VTT domain-containing protein [Syntrophomonadaceae bacterium]
MNQLDVKENNNTWLILMVVFLIALIILFFYLDRHNQLSQSIQALGLAGIILSVLFMAVLGMTPIPSEGLLVLLLKIYGIYEGTLYAWLGSFISSWVIFYLARYHGQQFFRQMITPRRFEMVDHWVRQKGTSGLFIARLLPLPAFVINYITGVMPSVGFWPYTWTAAVTIIPYYVGTALVYAGAVGKTKIWLVVGGGTVIILWAASFLLSRESKTRFSGEDSN